MCCKWGSTATSVFPQELIDRIIAENATDKKTLTSCALVCRAFCSPSQAQIFDHLDCGLKRATLKPSVDYPGCMEYAAIANDLDRLRVLLSNSPHLIEHIRSLKIQGWGASVVDTSVLQRLSNLHSVALEEITWSRLSHQDMAALHELCASPKIRTLSLLKVGPFCLRELSRLVGSPALKNLTLDTVRLVGSDEITTAEIPDHLRLTDFYVSSTPTYVVSWLATNQHLSQLQDATCELDDEPKTTVHIQKLLGTSSESLKSLGLLCTLGKLPEPLVLIEMTSLRCLRLFVDLEAHGAQDDSLARWTTKLLQSHSNPSALTEISLDVIIDQVDQLFLLVKDWDPLARFLSEERFPALQQFELALSGLRIPSTPVWADPIFIHVRSAFKRLDTEGKLVLTVEDNELCG
ncbi:hypothetical protein C8R43DRAFT_975267 [Mycena crocata]|nr:hypothetical protein C8R43DRAFT_975267 [Mycena crocata]